MDIRIAYVGSGCIISEKRAIAAGGFLWRPLMRLNYTRMPG
jgi:hypothetical protein